ncbi:MAG TPA: MFS transporter [Ktedonobacterales bacterium]|jgi:predicted MFS family arabinose efflux permease
MEFESAPAHLTAMEDGPRLGAPDTAAPAVPRHPLAPFKRPSFTLLFVGQLVSVLGDQVYGVALPWTVLAVTGDARQMAVVLTAGTVPRVLLLLVSGALADRLNPRVVMLAADVGRAAVVGALGITLFVGLPPLWVVAALAALEGAGSGLFGPGVQALLPRLVPAGELAAANGLMMVVQYATLAVGPVLGGVATAAQATFAFLADAASFVVSALALAGIRLPRRAPQAGAAQPAVAARQHLLAEIGAGLRYTFQTPLVRATMVVTILANLGFSGAFGVALIVLSRNLSPNPVTLGLLLAAVGVGGIVGGLCAGLLARRRRRGLTIIALWVLASLLMVALPFVAGPASHLALAPDLGLGAQVRIGVIAGMLGLIGVVLALGDTLVLTIMQQRIAPEYMARVFSVQFLAGGIGQPLSLVGAGLLVAAYGPGIVFVIGGALVLLAIMLGATSREIRHL